MGNNTPYAKEQDEFLRENCTKMTRAELTDIFNQKFGTNKAVSTIKGYCNRRGWKSGGDGRFKPGNISWQTGLSKDKYKSHFTEDSFKRSIAGIMDKRKYKIGDELVRRGVPMILISIEPNVQIWDRCVPKRRYVWEQAYGEIPEGHRIINLDGDPMNCDLDNLYCIPAKFIPLLNKNHWLVDSREHTLTAIKYCELYYAIMERKE